MDILDLLSTDKDVSGQTIAEKLSVSRAAVHKRIERLREQGYRIVGGNNLGYRIIARPSRLVADEIKRHVAPSTPVPDITIYPETTSTQSVAKGFAAKDAPEWMLVAAEKQTGSYGRMQRQWESSEGGLWFSFILRPFLLPERVPQITLLASIAICRAIENNYNYSPMIKWPNDILLKGKKLAGILTEMSAEIGRVNWLVIGVGINVNNFLSPNLINEAVSLGAVTGSTIDRSELLGAFLNEFHCLYSDFLRNGFRSVSVEYNRRSVLAGKRISVDGGDGVHAGIVEKIDDDGYLWLKTDDGVRKVVVGHVTIL